MFLCSFLLGEIFTAISRATIMGGKKLQVQSVSQTSQYKNNNKKNHTAYETLLKIKMYNKLK